MQQPVRHNRMECTAHGRGQLAVTGSAALLLLLVMAGARPCRATQLSTPWVTLEQTNKDRAISRQPWATYESNSVIGVNGVTPPTSPAAALDPANYQIAAGGGAAGPAIAEVSYRSRLLFLSLRATSNFPNPAAWGHHVFLKLASPLQGGVTYTITAAAAVFGVEVALQLAVDEQQQLNENIHVNQVGYTPDSPKVAVVGSYLGSLTASAPYIPATLRLPGGNASPFTVEDAASGAVAFAGTARLFGDGSVHENFKQLSWHLDFSDLVTPGRYHVRLPGLGLSHAFAIGQDAPSPALGALSRSMYGQRCGVALEQTFLSPWERPEPCHKDDAEVMAIDPPPSWFTNKMPLPAANGLTTLPPDPSTGSYFLPQAPGGTRINAVGGSHDAGDYGKYVVNSGSLVGWLMNSLEILGAENDDLPLPEAGDGIPDLLQVVQHELRFLEGMQDEDGGVFCVVKPNTTAGEYYEHHLPCGTPGRDSCNMAPTDPMRGPRIAWPKDTTCTAQFAGAMARVARSPWMQTFKPADAARYLSRAIRAWNFLQAKAPIGALCYHHYGCLGVLTAGDAYPPPWHNTYNCYDPQGDQSHDERLWAAVELFAATGQESYHTYFLERHCPRYRRWGWVMLPFSYGLATVTYAQLAAQQVKQPGGTSLQLNATMAAKCLDELATTARGYTAQAQASPYFLAVPERSFAVFGYGWQFQSSLAAHMLMAAAIAADTPAEAATWRGMAAAQLNYVLGANPQGFSLITGVGARRITNPVDDESVYDDIDAPWPGQIVALAGGFSWLNQYGAAQGAAFPPADYAVFNRIADGFNVATEYTVPELALAIGAFAALIGQAKTPLPSPPSVSVQPSTVISGPAPLSVDFQLSVAGAEGDVASLEWDFGDGGHSYQAAPRHTFQEPGRAFQGFATVVDRRGQAAVQKFSVFTSFAAGASPELPPPAGLAMVARVDHAAASPPALPALLVASQIAAGGNVTLGTTITADVVAGMAAAQDNLAWQGPRGAWTGAALRPTRFEDRASYDVAGSSSSSTQLILAGASGALVLDAWIYFNQFLTYGRDNVYLLGLVGRDNVLFGMFGTKWSGNQIVAGAFGAVADDNGKLKTAFTLGRWHHVRLAALPPAADSTGNGTCTAWVDGAVVGSKDCTPSGIFKFCASNQALKLVVGSFDGYVDALRVYASPTADLTSLCGSRPPPPPSPPPPAPPAPDQRFAPYLVTANTISVVDADSSCGLTGDAVSAGLPMKLFSGGYATGSLLPVAATYTAGLAVSSDNNRWEPTPVGCSLQVASEAVTNGSSSLKFTLPQSLLQRAITNNAFAIEAKVFVQSWRTGYSKWNSDVFGGGSNWDTFFKITHDLWRGPSVLLSTPSASTTGAFAGTLVNASALEAAVFVNAWHHIAVTANATTCVFSVDGREIAAGACEAKKLLWAKSMDITVGGFVGYLDELALTAAAVSTQVPNSVANGTTRQPPVPPAPSPPPPPSPPSPPPPKPVNRFSPLAVDASTIAVLETDALCGVSGGALNGSLVLKLFSGGAATGGTIAPASMSYTTGLSVSDANTQWAVTPSGCSLRVASEAVSGGNALVTWRLPKALLQPAIAANAFTLAAKVYIDKWRVGYSKWNSQMLSHSCNWDTYFNTGTDIWKNGYVQLSTPSAATTGAFAGTLANVTTLEAALMPEVWHHVALIANSTTCVFSVDGVEIAAGGCSAAKLLWQTYLTVSVGGFVGYVDDLVLSAAARPTQVPWKP